MRRSSAFASTACSIAATSVTVPSKKVASVANEPVHAFLAEMQGRIVAALEAADGGRFGAESWQRPEGGGGTTRVLEDGKLFERAGVNVSRVRGAALPASASAARPQIAGRPYEAMG